MITLLPADAAPLLASSTHEFELYMPVSVANIVSLGSHVELCIDLGLRRRRRKGAESGNGILERNTEYLICQPRAIRSWLSVKESGSIRRISALILEL